MTDGDHVGQPSARVFLDVKADEEEAVLDGVLGVVEEPPATHVGEGEIAVGIGRIQGECADRVAISEGDGLECHKSIIGKETPTGQA